MMILPNYENRRNWKISVLYFFVLLKKRGKTTLICEQLSIVVSYQGYDTKLITCDESCILETGIKIRCGKYTARYDDHTL